MMPLVSVLVPVYNVAPYLDRCLASIVVQNHDRLDIVVIDDGSTDSSPELCDRWAERDRRIRVIHQPNGGIAAARNRALDAAMGEYLCFVDSDDFIAADHVSSMLQALQAPGVDIAVSSFERTSGESPARARLGQSPVTLRSARDALKEFVGQNAMLMTVPWGKLASAGLWTGLRYPLGRLHEDEYVSHLLFERADVVAFLPEATYFYFVRPGSITETRLDAARYFDLWDALWAKAGRLEELGLIEQAQEIRRAMLRRAMRSRGVVCDEGRGTANRWAREVRHCAARVLAADPAPSVRAFALLSWALPRVAAGVYARRAGQSEPLAEGM